MARRLHDLGVLCARRARLIVAVWLLVAVAVGAAAVAAGSETNDNLILPGTDSQSASDLLSDRFPSQANGSVPIAIRAPSGEGLSRSEFKRPIEQVTRAYSNDPGVRKATGPFDRGGSLTGRGDVGTITLLLEDGPSDLSLDEAEHLVGISDPLSAAGLDAGAGGYLGQKLSKPSTHLSELVGILAAAVILAFTFGTLVAMGVPLLTAVIGLVIGFGSLTLLSHLTDVPSSAPALATMIGLGVGIDYALFMLTRYRGFRAAGRSTPAAIGAATATAGVSVVFAGTTVVIALLALWAAQIPVVTTLGLTAAIVVAVAMLAAVTLLPSILSLLGGRIERLRLPVGHKPHDDRPHGWARWAETVTRHPIVCLLVGFAVLIVLAIPVTSLTLGQQDNGALPTDTQSRQSYDIVRGGFGAGANGTILVSVDLEKPAKNDQASLDQLDRKQQRRKQQAQQQAKQKEQKQVESATAQLEGEGIPPDEASEQAQQQVSAQAPSTPGPSAAQQRKLEKQRKFLRSPGSDPRLVSLRKKIGRADDVDEVSPAAVNKAGDAAVLTVVSKSAPSSSRTADLVGTLRDDVLPDATSGNDETASVGGLTASYVDLAAQIGARLPVVIGLVLLLTFIVLMLAFRSLLVPLKAVVMNAFSIAAAFGVVSFVFSNDWTARLVGLEGAVPIVSYVPLMMFAILFGLSMDYEVFLMSHVREGWMASLDAREAIVHGVAGTARVITSAALIMVSVFCAFVISGDPTIKQFGVGMAVAVAVDATIVRCLLVPAILELLGRSAWYMPRRLDRALPRISVEGDPDAGR